MKRKGIKKNIIIWIFASFLIWRLLLLALARFGIKLLPFSFSFPYAETLLAPYGSPLFWSWANFDGVHYLIIAKEGYYQFQQAFFPLYPLLIRLLGKLLGINLLLSGLIISNLSFLLVLILFWRLLRLGNIWKIKAVEENRRWIIVFLLLFPTSFFFGSLYSESLFLALVMASFLSAKKSKWWLAGILGGLASAARLVGIFLLPALLWEWWEQRKLKVQSSKLKGTTQNLKLFQDLHNTRHAGFISASSKILKQVQDDTKCATLVFANWQFLWLLLIPLGLLAYMFYLGKNFGDPLYFLHAQPAFGAGRSGGKIILLPQVYWRYLKIFVTVPLISHHCLVALLEFLTFNWALFLLWQGYRQNLPRSWLIFSFLAVVAPTLTGTFSSMPRYVLVAFPIFIVPSLWKESRAKILLLTIYFLLYTILVILFTRGRFVA